MAPIPGKHCEDHYDRDGEHVPAEVEWDKHYQDSGDLFLCERCADRRIDGHISAQAEAFHGGSAPFSVQEQYDAAVLERQELRRRDG